MRILEITFVPPDMMSGGGRGILQSIKSILANATMTYLGPSFDMTLLSEMERDKIESVIFLERYKRTLFSSMRALFHGATTLFYDSWVEVINRLSWQQFDFVHIEASRYDFVVRKAKRHGLPVIIRLHNIEKDYGWNEYVRVRGIGSLIRYISFAWNEKACIRKADCLVFITERDKIRAEELYGKTKRKYIINPVCMEINDNDYNKEIEFILYGEK